MTKATSTFVVIGASVAIAASAALRAQHNFTPAEVENGGRLYQSSCAGCHGTAGDQVPGTALRSDTFRRARTDDEIARIIRAGIPGTSMPPNPLSETEAATIVAWLKGGVSSSLPGPPGDQARGKLLFEGKGKCASCHGPGGAGGRHAPALTDVGAIRQPSELLRSLVEPSAEIHPDFRTVTVTTKGGVALSGRLLNQNSYSIQMLDAQDRLRSLDKADLREVTIQPTSAMPSYRQTLTAQDVADVIGFLMTMRGGR